ncbi:hypothetical protein LX36DRAFT_690481 [Colletotrichum falcatum]|nr:hypothetical protein LX36DRAFT_690481 [Colletotrichum falcatum]
MDMLPYPQLRLVCHERHSWFVDESFRVLVLDKNRLDAFEDLIFIGILRRFMAITSSWPKRESAWLSRLPFSDQYRYGAPKDGFNEHVSAVRRIRGAGENQKSACPGWNCICNAERSRPSNITSQTILKGIASALAITCFKLSRHYYRPISCMVLGCLIRRGFPNLRRFHRETWRASGVPPKRSMDGYVDPIKALPAIMKDFGILCESNNSLQGQNAAAVAAPPSLTATPGSATTHSGMYYPPHLYLHELRLSAVKLCTRLRRFSAAYTVSFESFAPGHYLRGRPTYHRIQHLVMASDTLQDRDNRNSQEFIDLIVEAGKIAFDESVGFLMSFTRTYHTLSETEQRQRQPTLMCRGTRYGKEDLLPAIAKLNKMLAEELPHRNYPDIRFYEEPHALMLLMLPGREKGGMLQEEYKSIR